jgi:hypothetical protein
MVSLNEYMRKVIQFLGLPLALLFGFFLIIMFVVLLASSSLVPGFNYDTNKFGTLTAEMVPADLLATFGISVVYIIIGIGVYVTVVKRKKKTKESSAYAKRMVLRGIIGIASVLFVYFALKLTLSLFYLKLPTLSN